MRRPDFRSMHLFSNMSAKYVGFASIWVRAYRY